MEIQNITYLKARNETQYFVNIDDDANYLHAKIRIPGDKSSVGEKELVRLASLYIAKIFSPDEIVQDLSNQQEALAQTVSEANTQLATIQEQSEQAKADLNLVKEELQTASAELQKTSSQINSAMNIINSFVLYSDLTPEQIEEIVNAYPTVQVGQTVVTGEVYNIEGTLYKAIQTVVIADENWIVDPTIFVKFVPDNLDDGTEIIPTWEQPAGAHDAYSVGDKVVYNGVIYQSEVDSNVWPPDEHGWLMVDSQEEEQPDENQELPEEEEPEPPQEPEDEPVEEPEETVPEFVQPQGHNPYSIGDKVMFEGRIYESIIDGNVWSPVDHPAGWKEISA